MRFQYAVIVVDLAIIAFFILTPVLQDEPSFLWLDYSVAALLGVDLRTRPGVEGYSSLADAAADMD